MIISVASGKGGTGKTTVAINLALSLVPYRLNSCFLARSQSVSRYLPPFGVLERGTRLLDCDVEEPNAHLFLYPDITEKETVHTVIPEIDETRCNGCKKCAEICRFRALTVVAGKVLVFPELCHSCGGCMEVCPEGAVGEGRRELGVIESGFSGELGFSHGRLRVGEAMSPPLIRKVRTHHNGADTIIIDAPPGTSCPVITAMKGCDFILLVTEPTPFGLHDLKLAVEAVRVLGIPCGLIINRADMGDDQVLKYAEEEKVPLLLEIPFDRKIAEAYSHGRSIIEIMPEWRNEFRTVYRRIEQLVQDGGRVQ